MGHKRIPHLPRSKRWQTIVEEIANFSSEKNNIGLITERTLANVSNRFQFIENDSGVKAAFKFLLQLSYAASLSKPQEFFNSRGIALSENPSPIDLSKAVAKLISDNADSLEYAAFAKNAIIDTISDWYTKHNVTQEKLFSTSYDSFEVWRDAANGSGFCEISRSYFSKFTEIYLKYFLEREASGVISHLEDREKFNENLKTHLRDISNHSFEISKITQSYSAGWFNKHAKKDVPSDRKIKEYISFAFSKLRNELSRSEQNSE